MAACNPALGPSVQAEPAETVLAIVVPTKNCWALRLAGLRNEA